MIAGIIQLNSSRDIQDNLRRCTELAERGAAQGAEWLLFPENAPFLGKDRDKLSIAEPIDGPIVDAYRDIARDLGAWVTLGSFPEKSPSPDHTYNTQLTISPDGEIASIYRKIHLFDVELPDGTALLESGSILPGDELVTSAITGNNETWCVGLSICYDLRFPEMYRALRAKGAHALTIPAAFTMPTGHEHWHALLRARAIENQCYVLAPNQWGKHEVGRSSYGQSAIYDPWGRLLASAPERDSVITAELDMGYLSRVRQRMPCHDHRRIDDNE